ncbi:MAG: hypothetical protein E6G94_01765 [Alphaproteobacteria bacterium]|nr:MAG: hypothetical protein E6G94_01765 [Alphaproteobacteria bacterium]
MSTDAEREKVRRFAADCAAALVGDLRAVLVQRDNGVRKNPPPTVLIVTSITAQLLRHVAELARRTKGIALPLLLDDEYLTTSCDVFPLEILTLMRTCDLLWGDSNPLDGLVLDQDNLRLEIEQQLKGKVLHLRQAYLGGAGDKRSLRSLMLDSSAGFEEIMRGLLALAGREHAAGGNGSAREVESATGVSLETFRLVRTESEHGRPSAGGDVDELFHRYLGELSDLARAADRITRSRRT